MSGHTPERYVQCPVCEGRGTGQGDNTYCGYCGGDGSVPESATNPNMLMDRARTPDTVCDCENPPPPEGVADNSVHHCSEECPIHGDGGISDKATTKELVDAVDQLIGEHPVLRSHPIGAPHSPARARQERAREAEDRCRALVARLRGRW